MLCNDKQRLFSSCPASAVISTRFSIPGLSVRISSLKVVGLILLCSGYALLSVCCWGLGVGLINCWLGGVLLLGLVHLGKGWRWSHKWVHHVTGVCECLFHSLRVHL